MGMMGKVAVGLLVIGGLFLLMLGAIFMIAGAMDTIIMGVVMAVIGFALFGIAYMIIRKEAQTPTIVQQSVNVTMGGSGEFRESKLACKSCGAALDEKSIKLISGGLSAVCPYCGQTSVFEEEPKW
jgi:hypothetical protein